MTFTKHAIEHNYVRVEGDSTYFAAVPNGNYVATGRDIEGRPIRRAYVVNDMKDRQSVWAMWHDFNGRWGLRNIWHLRDDGSRRLIWRG